MTRKMSSVCAHCERDATGNAIARVGNRNQRLCAVSQYPYESPCFELVTIFKHELHDQCWKPLRIAHAIPHEPECFFSDFQKSIQPAEMRAREDARCHPYCFGRRMALANLILSHDTWIQVMEPPINVIASRLHDLRSGQANPLGVRLDPAVRASGQARVNTASPLALTATKTPGEVR